MTTAPVSIIPVILSGGSGTRLWPLSRETFPKQFWPLVGQRTMLAATALRGKGEGFAPPIVVCNEAHRFLVAEQLRDAGIASPRILLEPVGRNSAPAVATAALLAEEAAPGCVLWIMPADSAITDEAALQQALHHAVAGALAGRIVTFGMQPTVPETGFGYIEAGAALPGIAGVHDVARFVEKPDAATARAFLDGGRHLWNSGQFIATAGTLIAELERFAPDVLETTRAALAAAQRDLDFVRLDGTLFARCPSISIDYAVMERTGMAAVVPASLGWSDVGSWDALWQISPKDAAGNVSQGPVHLVGAKNCYVRSEGMLAGVVGLQDAVLVVTDDAVLAMHRSASQDVKRLVEQLKAQGLKQATEHRRMYRPWGHYEGLIQGMRFQVKKITVTPGGKLSLQKHFHRAEHWVVVNGTALVQRDEERIMVRENESVYLPLGCVHRMENPGKIPLTLIEVQVGSYTGEDDIVRIEDTYGRA